VFNARGVEGSAIGPNNYGVNELLGPLPCPQRRIYLLPGRKLLGGHVKGKLGRLCLLQCVSVRCKPPRSYASSSRWSGNSNLSWHTHASLGTNQITDFDAALFFRPIALISHMWNHGLWNHRHTQNPEPGLPETFHAMCPNAERR